MKKHISILLTSILLFSLFFANTFTVSAGFENQTFEKYTYTVPSENEATIIDVQTDISGEVVIPSSIEGNKVTAIDTRAFDNCDKITTLKIPAGVNFIGEAAFEECTSLTKFIVAFGNKDYCTRDGVLFNKDTTTLICYPPAKANTAYAIPDSVKKVDTAAIAYASRLEQITVADSVQSLGDQAFYQCTGLNQIAFGTGLTKIGAEAFAHCYALASITIPNSVTSVGISVFEECGNLSVVTIGRGLTGLSGTMFLNCTALKTIALPDNVTVINASAFSGCSKLESITIPKTVTGIGGYVFRGCDSLKTIAYTGSETERGLLVIGSKNETLAAAQWQCGAPSAEPSPEDTSVGPQPISGPDSNVIWAYVIIGGIAVVLTAVVAVVIIALVKGIKQRT